MKRSELLSCCMLLLMILDWTVCCPIVTNGCTTKINEPVPYQKTFTPACNKHDVCYFCGQFYGWSRRQCDNRFHSDMKKLCPRDWYGVRLTCKAAALVFYGLTRNFGSSHYDSVSPSWCEHPCAREFGDPNKGL